MRMTESILRSLIRSVIAESVDMEGSAYPFSLIHDGHQVEVSSFNQLCVSLASIVGYIIYDEPYENYDDYSSSHEIEIDGLSEVRKEAVKDAFNTLTDKCKDGKIFIGRIGELSRGYEDTIVEEEGAKELMTLVGNFCSKGLGF